VGVPSPRERTPPSPGSGTTPRSRSTVIGIASGKGGTGKTVLSVNLALELVRRGKKVLYLDADFGLANGHLLMGIEPRQDIRGLLSPDPLPENPVEEGPWGLRVIPGASGTTRLASLHPVELCRMADRLEWLREDTDFLVLDSAAGIAWQTLVLLHAASYVVLVTTPETPALTDAYAVAKALLKRSPDRELGIVLNRIADPDQGRDAFARLSGVLERFLGRRPQLLGMLREAPGVRKSVEAGTPFVVRGRRNRSTLEIRSITEELLHALDTRPLSPQDGFSRRLRVYLSGGEQGNLPGRYR
jgi:flagellar biosynthesis protein FlhG